MSLKKVSAATIIALSLAACGSNPPSSTLPNTNPTVTNPSNSNQTNNGNAAANNGNSANSGNTAANNGNSANSGNTADSGNSANNGNSATNNPPPFTRENGTPNFSVSVSGLKREAEGDVRKLAAEYGVDDATVLTYQVSALGQNANGGSLDLSKVPLKQLTRAAHRESAQVRAKVEGVYKTYTLTRSGESHIYRQNYSLIAGIKPTSYSIQGPGVNETEPISDEDYLTIKGTPTKTLPEAGKATYSGAAFDGKNKGVLNYSVDFKERTGEGNITGLGEKVVLNKGSITHIDHNNEIDGSRLEGHGIKGSSNKGDSALGFFGANAEEIVGTVNHGEIGFAGSR